MEGSGPTITDDNSNTSKDGTDPMETKIGYNMTSEGNVPNILSREGSNNYGEEPQSVFEEALEGDTF